jgi:hypothetical protein
MVLVWGILITLVVCLAIRYVSDARSESRQEENQRREQAESMEMSRRAIQAFTVSTRSATDWQAQLCRQGSSAIFSSDLQNALIRSDSRPALLTGELEDIREAANSYVFIFRSHPCANVTLRLELVGDQTQSHELMANRKNSTPYYAVALFAESVEKDEQTTSDSDSTERRFVVRGRCANTLFTGLDGEILDLNRSYEK